MPFEPGTLIDGKLRVVRLLGAGGMGAVYEVEHELTKHRRALKLLHPAMAANEAVVGRFLREASAAGRIGNPHIVETHDAGRLSSGEPYLLLSMLKGRSLGEELSRCPQLPIPRLADLVRQACEGVQAAHDAGIVHRDLKPDNLFVTDRDGGPFVTVLDFGVSKFDPEKTDEKALTADGAALGTPYYMAPEQVRGTGVDARTDVYALGVILYEGAAGKRPYDATSLPELVVKIHTGRPTPLGELRALPVGFEQVVARAMAVEKDDRFPSAQALGAALAAFVTADDLGATVAVQPMTAPAAAPRPAPREAVSPPFAPLDETAPLHPDTSAGLPTTSAEPHARRSRVVPAVLALALGCAAAVAFFLSRGPSMAPSTVSPDPTPPARTSSSPPADPPTITVASSAPPSASSVAPSPAVVTGRPSAPPPSARAAPPSANKPTSTPPLPANPYQ
jgi:serine/threonine-protein kinase